MSCAFNFPILSVKLKTYVCILLTGFSTHKIACVAGVRKGRGRELGRETVREGGGRREEGNAYKEAIVLKISKKL